MKTAGSSCLGLSRTYAWIQSAVSSHGRPSSKKREATAASVQNLDAQRARAQGWRSCVRRAFNMARHWDTWPWLRAALRTGVVLGPYSAHVETSERARWYELSEEECLRLWPGSGSGPFKGGMVPWGGQVVVISSFLLPLLLLLLLLFNSILIFMQQLQTACRSHPRRSRMQMQKQMQ